MYLIRSVIFLLLWFIWTFLWGIICLPIFLFKNRNNLAAFVCRIWAKITLFLLRISCGINSNVIGNVPNIPCIIASKHQSAWETIFFLTLFDNPVFIIKKELTHIPIYGWYLSVAGMIIIDRKNGSNALKQIKLGSENALKKNRSVIIFPEGTRTKPEEYVRYKSGIKFLHENFQDVPIIPIALNSGLHWINKSIIKRSGTVRVQIFPQFSYKVDFLSELQDLIDKKSSCL